MPVTTVTTTAAPSVIDATHSHRSGKGSVHSGRT